MIVCFDSTLCSKCLCVIIRSYHYHGLYCKYVVEHVLNVYYSVYTLLALVVRALSVSVASHTLRFDGACTFARSDVNGIAAAATAGSSVVRSVPFVRRFRFVRANALSNTPSGRLGHTAATVSCFLYL